MASLLSLPSLPVYRENYCSQDQTNNLIELIEQEDPALIVNLSIAEKRANAAWKHGDSIYQKSIVPIVNFLRQKQKEEQSVPETRLGMLDFLYEISKRVRAAENFPLFPVFGVALAPSLEGPFPELIDRPLDAPHRDSFLGLTVDGQQQPGLSMAEMDAILRKAYSERPAIFFEHAEQNRYLVKNPEIQRELSQLLKINERPDLLAELNLRITKMCKINYKEVQFISAGAL